MFFEGQEQLIEHCPSRTALVNANFQVTILQRASSKAKPAFTDQPNVTLKPVDDEFDTYASVLLGAAMEGGGDAAKLAAVGKLLKSSGELHLLSLGRELMPSQTTSSHARQQVGFFRTYVTPCPLGSTL